MRDGHRTHVWRLAGSTCERGDFQPIELTVEATVSQDNAPILVGLRLSVSGPGVTCGEKWSPTWSERAVTKLGWVGRSVPEILRGPRLPDAFTCACTEVSLGPKLWRLLASLPQSP